MTVKVVTDSTADLPPQVADELGIAVVPLYVHFGTQVFRDGLDLGAEEFYQRLLAGPALPTTSAPSPGTLAELYQKLGQETKDILSLHISGKLSATVSSALLAKEQARESCRVEVVDSQTVSMALGLLAIHAARRARAGASLDDLAHWVKGAIPHTHLFGLLDTLEYIHKGGRIGKAQAFLGTLLKVKPLVAVREGEVHPVERVRSHAKGVEKLKEMVGRIPDIQSLALVYSTEAGMAEEMAHQLAPIVPRVEMFRSRFGPVLGTYVGPRGLGVAVLQKVPE